LENTDIPDMPIPSEKDLKLGLFSLSRTLNFHLELTDKCNAGCPMCGRTVQMDRCRPDFEKVRNIELSLDVIRRNFPPDFCRRVDTIDLCGGLGDPPAARECLEICEYFVDNGIKLILSSNGGLRSEDWWRKLGHLFSPNSSFVEFHIDGLADTNHLYRINTRFSKIMTNAQAFLDTGATGEWHFIPFKHNQHQLAEALSLSRKMGFRSFRVIDTIRFGNSKSFVYQMPDGSIRHLEPSSDDIVSHALGKDTPRQVTKALDAQAPPPISCKSANENRPYIVADGSVSACCWVEGSDDEKHMYSRAKVSRKEHNINRRLLQEILLEEPYRQIYPQAWEEGCNPVCIRKCGLMRRNTRREL
jgi:MoaA/NifB/PqqE/SkfB family radical SAM enzyme